jgi:UDP-N-acetylmuramoyl-tripeptide--D-alanyl-D-alanine ligase
LPTASVAQLVKDTGGSLLRGDPDAVVRSYEIDTRRIEPGGAFFALKGERTDGHEFLEQAQRAGATAAIVERDPGEQATAPASLILVDNTVAALGRCGTQVRRRNDDETRWIALTGSNGKTTTKEMIAAALSAEKRVYRTPGNFNNDLGVPLTLLAMPEATEVAVIELAMKRSGEIARLVEMTRPDIGLVTNIRAVHMTHFESLDDLAAAKGEMYAVLRDEAIAVVNLDDVHTRVQAARHIGPRVTFGQHPEADLRLVNIENRLEPGVRMTFRHGGQAIRVQLRMAGTHAAVNSLAALAVVVAAGGEISAAAERIEQLEAGPGRGRIHRLDRGIVVIDESYNCSPPALASVLETLSLSKPSGRRALALGDMLELGTMATALHREAGRRAAAANVALLIAVGKESKETAASARRSGVPEVYHFADSKSAAQEIAEFIRDGDLLVVKGSRGMRMERIVDALAGVSAERR